MRGDERVQDEMFSSVTLEQRVPQDYPLREIRKLTDVVLRSLSDELLRHNGGLIALALGLSRATVSRIVRRNGMKRLKSLDPPPLVVRYKHKRPGDLIHFDIKRLARIVQPGHRVHGDYTRKTTAAGYEYLHIASDDHSRIAFAAIRSTRPTDPFILFFHMTRAHFSRLGISCRRVLTDNNSCYRDHRFQTLLYQQCVKHRFRETLHKFCIHSLIS